MVSPVERELRQKLKEIRDHITRNANYVGPRFSEEARKIHYGETEKRSIYGEAVAAARTRRRPGQALVATGHLYLTGGQAAWLSERRVLLGGVEALEGDMFGDELAYVALGHLHKAQKVGRDHVRYAGSPILPESAVSAQRQGTSVATATIPVEISQTHSRRQPDG